MYRIIFLCYTLHCGIILLQHHTLLFERRDCLRKIDIYYLRSSKKLEYVTVEILVFLIFSTAGLFVLCIYLCFCGMIKLNIIYIILSYTAIENILLLFGTSETID